MPGVVHRTLRRAVLPVLAATVLLTTVAQVQAAADGGTWGPHHNGYGTSFKGSTGSDPFVAGKSYYGDFPDPSVVRVGSRYYGYSTTIAGKNLPVLTSVDLKHWFALPKRSGVPDNDALPQAARWANTHTVGSRRVAMTWAPTVVQSGRTWIEAYATQRRDRSRFCVSTARAASPTGPFKDVSTGPLVCPTREGAIDPYFWRSPGGALYLLWKTEGIRGEVNARLWIRRVTSDATKFVPGTTAQLLLTADARSWEGHVIENPALQEYQGRYYLFYSGNDWASSKYAVGYAVCETILGPCERRSTTPLMASTTGIAGPGGESPFTDTHGALRMAYHSWTPGKVGYASSSSCRTTSGGCPQRRMRIASLVADADGTLSVSSYVVR